MSINSYILSNIFNYKINKIKNDIPRCGFPTNASKRVMAEMEEEKIDYIKEAFNCFLLLWTQVLFMHL